MKRYFSFFLSILLIFSDQFSKYLIRSQGGFYVCNKNVALGITLPAYIFWSFWILIILVLFLFIGKIMTFGECRGSHFQKFPVFFILSGAVSNMIDRITHGCVIDFIDLKFWPSSIATRSVAGWPVFNLADAFIVAGVIMLILTFNKQPKTSKEAEK